MTPDEFEFFVTDNGGTENGGTDTSVTSATMTVNITPVNDAPFGKDKIVGVFDGTTQVLTTSDFGFTDPSDNHGLSEVVAVTVPTKGELQLAGVPVLDGDVISAADIDAGLLTYVAPTIEESGQTELVFHVIDDGGVATSGDQNTSADTNTLRIDINPPALSLIHI